MQHSPAVEVEDRPTEGRFVAELEGHLAELAYRHGDGRLVLTHTGVPEEIEGRGVASALVRAAVRRAADEGLTVAPWCPYARSWLEKHPDDAATITVDRSPPTRG